MESENIIGKRIHEIRREKNLTMGALADIAGTTKGTVSRWESGEIKTLRIDKIKKIADTLGYNPMWIMGFDIGKYPQDEETTAKIDQLYTMMTKMTKEQIDKVYLFFRNFL